MSVHRFPRRVRLLQASDFKRVFGRSLRSADTYFTVLAAISSAKCSARLGLAISKKQVGRAVDRNRLKRLARESFRHHNEKLVGLDLVVMARKQALDVGNARLSASLERHWLRLIDQSDRLHREPKQPL